MPTLIRAKFIVVGDASVGKSSLCQVFHSDGSFFNKNYTMTTGVEMVTKQINIPDTKDSVEIYLYDSAGKEIFTDHVSKFWDHPSGVVVVYDAATEATFSNCQKWLDRVRQTEPNLHIPGVLIANKVDLDQRRRVSPKAGKDFALSHGLAYFECSAKEMQGVDAPFYFLANEFYKLYQERIETLKSLS
ncbi:hypothetical protein ACJMK2_035485 [Sinanodonta woodiana]|uniref:Intraflagellar transport protein 27 homolog n=1 Tax=Sinanodonta woodiana TaxID=1069815 RepID=A0ABD3WWW4_SINWO